MNRFLFFPLFAEADAGGGAGGAAGAGASDASADWVGQVYDPTTKQFAEGWHLKTPNPAEFEPYAKAKTPSELIALQQQRLNDTRGALHKAKNPLPRPAADAPADHWKQYREQKGLPVEPAGYGLERPQGLADELWDEAGVQEFADLALKHDASPELVKAAHEWWHNRLQTGASTAKEAQAQEWKEIELKEAQALGQMFGTQVDAKLRDFQAVAQEADVDPGLFTPGHEMFLGIAGVKFASWLLDRLPRGEDGMVNKMGAPTGQGQYNLEWAKAVKMDPKHPDHAAWKDPRNPRHAEVNKLMSQAYTLGVRPAA